MKSFLPTLSLYCLFMGCLPPAVLAQPCGKEFDGVSGRAGTTMMAPYETAITGPENRRCNLEREMAKQYKEATDEQRAMIRPGDLLVMVRSIAPRIVMGSWFVPPNVDQVVLKAGQVVVKPKELTPVPQPWTNAGGMQMQTLGADVWFDLSELPPGAFSVLVVAGGKEWKLDVKTDKRSKHLR